MSQTQAGTILLVGASRGLGLAMAAELLDRGWQVVATVRGGKPTRLHELAERWIGRLSIEVLDIDHQDEIQAFRERLSGRVFDILFVNAGVANAGQQSIARTSTEEFVRVMTTNALSPMRVIEALEDLVADDGTIGVMSSGQGSIANNNGGGLDLYRGSKAALNQFMQSYVARRTDSARAFLLMAPGWIRTDLGGDDAPVGVEEAVPAIVDILVGQRGQPGLRYLDRDGKSVSW